MRTGTVVNCMTADVYSKMNAASDVIDRLECLSIVEILDNYKFEDLEPVQTKTGVYFEPKNPDFIRVKTGTGKIGYMKKKYLAIKEE